MIVPAAAVVPRLPDGRVLTGTRTLKARSFPGFLAFPGGCVDEEDERLPLASGASDERAERAAALRELGEESGRWLVCRPGGAGASDDERRALIAHLEGGALLEDALAATQLILDDRELIPLGRWVTPDFMPHRFSVRQMLLPLEADLAVLGADSGELEGLAWRDPLALHEEWRQGEALLLPPIRFVAAALAAGAGAGDDLAALAGRLKAVPPEGEPELRELVAGVAVQPYRTPTLPPARHTNTVLLGSGDFFIVDPATPYAEEQARFDALLERLAAAGRRPLAVLLTHHHTDHMGDAARVAERYGLEVWAHPATAALLPFAIERELQDGELLVAPGDPERRLRVLFTPGHAPGHLCFLDEATGVLVAGDMVASVGSILIDPPEGHMGTYLESLARLAGSGARRVVPAHGPMLADGQARLAEQLEHRGRRQGQVEAALPEGAPGLTPAELVPGIYGGEVPEAVFPLAARSVLAVVEHLVESGRATRSDDRYFRTAPA